MLDKAGARALLLAVDLIPKSTMLGSSDYLRDQGPRMGARQRECLKAAGCVFFAIACDAVLKGPKSFSEALGALFLLFFCLC